MTKTRTRQAADGELTREQIILAAEEALTRFGPMKTTVVDVARILGVSHGNVYRYFDSKVALRQAVIEKWLDTFVCALRIEAEKTGSSTDILTSWINTLWTMKKSKYEHDVELFTTYRESLVDIDDAMTSSYYGELTNQLALILRSGVASGEFRDLDIDGAAKGILGATTKFHHPRHATEWGRPDINVEFQNVWALILGGILARPAKQMG